MTLFRRCVFPSGNRAGSAVSLDGERFHTHHRKGRAMKNLTHISESSAPTRGGARALLVTLALAGLAAVLAGQAQAAPASGERAAHRAQDPELKDPKLHDGVLTVKGTRADDRIALRLQAGQPGVLQVDDGDDGTADFSFDRAAI